MSLRSCLRFVANNLRLQNVNHIIQSHSAAFSTSSPRQLKEIVKTLEDDGKTIVVEGKTVESERAKNLLQVPPERCHACTLCRLNLDIKYTDVLILRQFMTERGQILPRNLTGVCIRSQSKLKKLIHQAHRAGLFTTLKPNPKENGKMSSWKWRQFPAYYD